MNIPWDKIIELILALIGASLLVGASREEVKKQLRNPGPWQRLRLERAVRREMGLRPREWMKVRHEVMEEILKHGREATEEDLDLLVEEAESWQHNV